MTSPPRRALPSELVHAAVVADLNIDVDDDDDDDDGDDTLNHNKTEMEVDDDNDDDDDDDEDDDEDDDDDDYFNAEDTTTPVKSAADVVKSEATPPAKV